MKKLLLSVIVSLVVGISNLSYGQVSGYTFAQTAPAFPPAIGGTTHTTGTTDYATYSNIPLGFTFCYNGVNYTAISICNDGYIVMGSSIFGTTTPISSGSEHNVIAALAADLQGLATGSLKSQMTGVAPNRKFTVQWLHYEKWLGTDDYSFQIVLSETSNQIQIYYTATTIVASNTFQVGLSGTTNADFNNRTKANATNWTVSSAGVANTDVMSTGGNAARSPNGCFTWSAPAACSGAPAAGTATSPGSVCSGVSFSIPLTGYTGGCGMSYQWQSASAIGGPYTDVAGQTSTTFTGTQSATTYYRCISTCSNGGPFTATSSVATVSMSAPSACYCSSTATSTSDMDVTNITFGTINNTSATVSLTGSQGNATGTAGMYSNWTASTVPVPLVMQGSSNAFSVTIGGTAYNHRVDVYIDFNQDGDFADAGESLPIFAYANPLLPNTTASSISIPLTATPGVTRMRVVCVESSSTSDCGTYTWGETEDYNINITAAAACAGTPTGGTTVSSINPICPGGSTVLSVTGSSIATGLTYQWQSSVDNSTWTNIPGETGLTCTVSPAANTYYRRVITCTASGLSANSVVVYETIGLTAPCYCSSTATSTSDMDITKIQFGTINNTSATVSLTGSQGTATGTAGMYSDWTASAVPVPAVQQGSTTAFTVIIGGTAYSHRVDVYIDFNHDGDFADADESFPIFAYANPLLPNTTASSITIPITALTGNTVMRVVCVESSSSNYCGTYTWGETEDYMINITAAPACSGAPAGGTIASSVNPICPGGSTVLSISGSSIVSGLTYQWQSAPAAGGPWTNIPGETGLTCTVTPSANTYYRRVTNCTLSGGLSANSTTVYETIVLTAACYCASAATSTSDMDITKVQYGTINNTSATVSLTGSQGNATGTAGLYSNWTASTVPVPNIAQNVSTAFTVIIGGTAYSHRVDVYIDFNQDGDFVDIGENFPIFAYANPLLPNTTVANITIPCSATLGQTTMRVVCVESSSSSPCGTYTWGETEDYKINITAGGVCAGTPTPGTAVASVATISSCASPTSIVSLTGATTSCGITYQWQSAPAAVGPWTNITGATNAYYISSPATNTYYRCILTCSGLSATSTSVLVSVTISIPANNECSGAIALTVNSDQSCGTVTSGTVNCTSASAEANTCYGSADDDVWFTFVATAGSHDITISNVAGSVTDMYHSVYAGTCGAMGAPLVCSDPNTSTVTGLTVGNTYYVRVYTYTSTPGQTTTFDICIGTQPGCSSPPNCNLNYTLSSIAHAPVSYATGTTVTFSDDKFAPSYTPIGFSFCFDGITYTSCLISSNGYLIFPSCYSAAPSETSVAPGGYSPYSIDGPAIPNTTDAPRNAILAPWQDIDPGVGGTTRYETTGSAPNRIFIVKYDNIAMFDCNSSKFSGQVMLYETTNNIEVHIKEKTICATWNGSDAILGLHNYNGTIAVTNAAHNYPNNWTETNKGYRFTSNCGAACATLPVKLMLFTAEAQRNMNVLHWVTSTEINNDYFVVESSTNMIDFKDIAHVDGAGNSNLELGYQYVDNTPFEKVVYYRLRQVDFDGKWSYSDIVSVKSLTEGEVNIYPNPAKENLFIDVNLSRNETYTINYVNVLGSVTKEYVDINEDQKTYKMNEFNNLKPGIYFIKVMDGNNQMIKYQKIVKE